MSKDNQYKVFDYIIELDAFTVNGEFSKLVEKLKISEWSPVVFIGRYLCLDNDYGEHWFDNWELRESPDFVRRARSLGYEPEFLMIIDPRKFYREIRNKEGKIIDGPCHPPELRKAFWTDVLKSLTLSESFLRQEARHARQLEREAVN